MALAVALLAYPGLGGCDSAEQDNTAGNTTGDSAAASSTATADPEKRDNGFTLKSGDLSVDATTSASLLPAPPTGELDFRLMGGWVNAAAAAEAGQETDRQAQLEQGRSSFGTMNLSASVAAAEPGTYQLAPSLEADDSAVVLIPAEPDLSLTSEYTSQSGTLTLETVKVEPGQGLQQVTRVTGTFDGTFVDDQGDERPFTGTFHFAPED